jgi:ATP-binding cassette subfamily B protein
MRDAPLRVVLDEPTASLDAPTETALLARHAATAREAAAAHGTITLLISHRFSTVRAADLIVVLEHGSVREIGSHRTLIAAGGTYAQLSSYRRARTRDAGKREPDHRACENAS